MALAGIPVQAALGGGGDQGGAVETGGGVQPQGPGWCEGAGLPVQGGAGGLAVSGGRAELHQGAVEVKFVQVEAGVVVLPGTGQTGRQTQMSKAHAGFGRQTAVPALAVALGATTGQGQPRLQGQAIEAPGQGRRQQGVGPAQERVPGDRPLLPGQVPAALVIAQVQGGGLAIGPMEGGGQGQDRGQAAAQVDAPGQQGMVTGCDQGQAQLVIITADHAGAGPDRPVQECE